MFGLGPALNLMALRRWRAVQPPPPPPPPTAQAGRLDFSDPAQSGHIVTLGA
jgi:hypothetical protein